MNTASISSRKLLSKSLAFTTVLLLAAGAVNHLAAQANPPLALPRVVRTYTGTVTQTSAAGVVSTGTFSLKVEEKGVMYATTVVAGTTSTYGGVVSRASLGESRTNGSGYVQFLPQPVSVTTSETETTVSLSVDGQSTATVAGTVIAPGTIRPIVFGYPKIPVVITPSETYGGILSADGSSMLFRGDRLVAATGN